MRLKILNVLSQKSLNILILVQIICLPIGDIMRKEIL